MYNVNMFSMDKKRKHLITSIVIIGIIMGIATIPVAIYDIIYNMPDDWVWFYIMLFIDVVCVIALLILSFVVAPKITKQATLELIKANDFNIASLNGKVNNVFDVYHSEIVGAEFLSDKVVFKRVKFSSTGAPVLKDEQKVLIKRKVEISDLCTFDMEVPYSDLSFSVVTNRNCWNAVPNIGIAIKFNNQIVDTFLQNDEYAIINASKELLYYVLGNENELKNSELLNEKVLDKKPKIVKKFVFHTAPWWVRTILILVMYSVSVLLGVFVTPYVFLALPVMVALTFIMFIYGRRVKLIFYNEHFSDGIKLCTIKEIIKVYKKQLDKRFSAVAIVTPVFTLMYPFREDLWKFLQSTIPNKTIND